MTKLIYPNNGIYNYCRNDLENISSNLSNAIENCVFDIPNEFKYKAYLNNLNYLLSEYYKEINSINSKLRKTNDNYKILSDDLENDAKSLVAAKIKERDRMII